MNRNILGSRKIQVAIALLTVLSIAMVQAAYSQTILDTEYEVREERVIWDTAQFDIINGTPYTYHDDALEEVAPGQYNLTLPSFSQGAWVDLNESVDSIEFKISIHYEIPEELTQDLYLREGYQLTMGNQYFTLRYSPDLSRTFIGTVATVSATDEDVITLENATGFNATTVFTKCEFSLWPVSLEDLSDLDSISPVQNHTILFTTSFEITLRYAYAKQGGFERMSILIIETVAITSLGFGLILAIPRGNLEIE